VTLVEERNPLRLEPGNLAVRSDHELDNPSAEVRLNLVLAHERGLVFRAPGLHHVDFTRVAVLGLVVVPDEEDVRLLSPLVGLHDFLHRVGGGVGRPAAGVDEAHDGVPLLAPEHEVVLHVSQVLEVVTPHLLGGVLQVPSDVDTLTLDVPPLVVIARDEVGRDALPLRPVLGEVGGLPLDAVGDEVELVEPRLAVNHVAELVDLGDSLLRPDVEQGVEDIEPAVPASEVVVSREAEPHLPAFELRDVEDGRLGRRDVTRQLDTRVHDLNVVAGLTQTGHHVLDVLRGNIEVVGNLFHRPHVLALAEERENLLAQLLVHDGVSFGL